MTTWASASLTELCHVHMQSCIRLYCKLHAGLCTLSRVVLTDREHHAMNAACSQPFNC